MRSCNYAKKKQILPLAFYIYMFESYIKVEPNNNQKKNKTHNVQYIFATDEHEI